MNRFVLSFGALLVALPLSVPATGTASAGAGDRRPPGTYLRPDGLFDVVLPDGYHLVTHGAEPRTSEWADSHPHSAHGAHGTHGVHGHGTGMAPGDPERPPACTTPLDFYQHVLYARPTWSSSRLASLKPSIQSAIRRMNHVLNEEALESGGRSADFKVLCDLSGNIQVDEITITGVDYNSVVAGARDAGHILPNVDYTIFVDASHIYCGQGSFWPDERPTIDNANNSGGAYGMTWWGCWYGRTPMHENGHNQGAVQYSAPNSTGSGSHCNDQIDVMCYSDGGDRDRGDFTACADRIHYDCNHDTYFDVAPEPGEWLSDHWNIGSANNLFIRLS